jgi:hypothetical protein
MRETKGCGHCPGGRMNGTSIYTAGRPSIHLPSIRPLQTAVACLGIVAESLAVSTGVLSEGHLGIEGSLRGVVDLSNIAMVEADALVGTRSRVLFNC